MRVSIEILRQAEDFSVVGEETFGYSEIFGEPHNPHWWEFPKHLRAFGVEWVGNTAHYSWGIIEYWSPSGAPNRNFIEVEDGFYELC